jgi:hypothetical protein
MTSFRPNIRTKTEKGQESGHLGMDYARPGDVICIIPYIKVKESG